MATPTLVETAGSATANTYASLIEAGEYFDTQLYRSDFVDPVDDDIRNRALLMATRILDEQMDWYGFKNDDQQALRWPRQGVVDRDGYDVDSLTIPQEVKNATAELAGNLIAENRTAENDTKGFKEMQAGTLRLVIDKNDRKKVLPESVVEMLTTLGRMRSKKSNKLVRV